MKYTDLSVDEYADFEKIFIIPLIKYEELISIITERTDIERGDTVDVYINLDSVFSNIAQSTQYNQDYANNKSFERYCVSGILNIISHYRRFFINSDVYARISLYASKTIQSDSKLLDAIYTRVLPIVSDICRYLADINIYVSDVDVMLMPYIINNYVYNKSDNFKLIISNDPLDDVYYLASKTIKLKYKKRNNRRVIYSDIDSILIDEYKIKDEFHYIYHNSFYLSLLIGVKGALTINRRYEKIFGYGSASLTKQLKRGLDDRMITMNTKSIAVLKQIFPDDKKDAISEIAKNCDLKYKLMRLTPSDINNIIHQNINLFDTEGLKELDSRVFKDYPISLDDLTRLPRFKHAMK